MAKPKAKAKKPARKAAPAKRRLLNAAPAPRMAARQSDDGDRQRAVERFLYRQAALLDGRHWAEFIELFATDGIYWVPASPEQSTGDGVPSIFYEDRDLMTVRMKRMQHPHAWSQMTAWGTNHVVSNVVIDNSRNGEIVARSRFHLMEFRNDATRHFAGSYIHHLKRTKSGLQIKLQRVDLVNAQGPYDYVIQAWV